MSTQSEVVKGWYDQYFKVIYLFVKGYLAKQQIPYREKEVEDLVQSTFLSILERKTDTPIEYPLAYLKKTAVSQIRIFYERKARIQIRRTSDQLIAKIAEPPKRSNLEKFEDEQQVWNLLNRILNQLESSIVFKRAVQGYSYKEIAQQENISSEKHLHVLYHRAKLKLHRYFKKKVL